VKGGDLLGRVVLGRYRVVRLLARGGMGEIYLARSEGAAGFAIPVVVKSVLAQYAADLSVLEMFKREARIMSNLRHPGIVSVLDFGVEGGDYLMVLEYVHGFHVGRWARWLASRGRPFPVERAIQVVLTMLDALAYAHSRKDEQGAPLGIVHRDISPSNVLVDIEGHVKIADFGIARMRNDNTEVSAGEQAARTVKGKFPYLPADLLLGSAAPDAGLDVYATAVVLDELLRGANPFRADDPQLTVGRVVHLVPERLDAVRPDVSRALADVVAKALAKEAASRFATAEELARALRAVRRASPDEAAAELAEAARRDFSDPTMARDLGVEDLSVLARAWKEAPAAPEERLSLDVVLDAGAGRGSLLPTVAAGRAGRAGSAAPAERRRREDEPTQEAPTGGHAAVAEAEAASRLADSRGAEPGGARRGLIAAVGVLALLALGAAAVAVVAALRKQDAPQQPVYLVVDRGGSTAAGPATDAAAANGAGAAGRLDDAPDAAGATAAAGSGAAQAGGGGDGGGLAGGPATPADGGGPARRVARAARASEREGLEAPVRRRAPEIGACFAQHVEGVEGTPQLVLRFDVGEDGSVRSVDLEPSSLEPLPLGRCVLGVARSTRFPPREEPVVFRIPLGARRAN
jgi:serine/threonine-protein kinase